MPGFVYVIAFFAVIIVVGLLLSRLSNKVDQKWATSRDQKRNAQLRAAQSAEPPRTTRLSDEF